MIKKEDWLTSSFNIHTIVCTLYVIHVCTHCAHFHYFAKKKKKIHVSTLTISGKVYCYHGRIFSISGRISRIVE